MLRISPLLLGILFLGLCFFLAPSAHANILVIAQFETPYFANADCTPNQSGNTVCVNVTYSGFTKPTFADRELGARTTLTATNLCPNIAQLIINKAAVLFGVSITADQILITGLGCRN